MTKNLIWGNISLDIEDWREDILADLLDNEEIDTEEDASEEMLYELMQDMNSSYMESERMNLDIQLPESIVAIAYLGLWNGRRYAHKFVGRNISNCLYSESDYCEWYVDQYGNFRATMHHHDGVNRILYRMIKPDLTERQRENFMGKVHSDEGPSKRDIAHYTVRLGEYIGKVYGWTYSGTPAKTYA